MLERDELRDVVRRVVVVRRCFLAFAPITPPMIAPAMMSPASAATSSAGITASDAARTAPVIALKIIVLLQSGQNESCHCAHNIT
jgi:hypothetical protein